MPLQFEEKCSSRKEFLLVIRNKNITNLCKPPNDANKCTFKALILLGKAM